MLSGLWRCLLYNLLSSFNLMGWRSDDGQSGWSPAGDGLTFCLKLLISWTLAPLCQYRPPSNGWYLTLGSPEDVGVANLPFKVGFKSTAPPSHYRSQMITAAHFRSEIVKNALFPTLMERHYILKTAYKVIPASTSASDCEKDPGAISCMYKEEDRACTRS